MNRSSETVILIVKKVKYLRFRIWISKMLECLLLCLVRNFQFFHVRYIKKGSEDRFFIFVFVTGLSNSSKVHREQKKYT